MNVVEGIKNNGQRGGTSLLQNVNIATRWSGFSKLYLNVLNATEYHLMLYL